MKSQNAPLEYEAPSIFSYRFQLMKQIEKIVVEELGHPWNVHELCIQLHVSERSLRYIFHEFFGMSPMTYLKTQRLQHAHRHLQESSSAQTTVTDVAIQWGFWHMGQFAKDYKDMFGERPSETLRRL